MQILRRRPLLIVPVLATTIAVGIAQDRGRPDATTSAAYLNSRSVQASCTIADEEFFAPRPIDNSSCGVDGTADSDDAHKAQNRLKNNLCAGGFLTQSPTVDPVRATQFSFKQLEVATKAIRTQLGISEGELPQATDRPRFAQTIHTTSNGDDLGEGTLVQYVGFLLEGHFTGEESVNCGRKRQENFDIHMAFVGEKPPANPTEAQSEALECSSVTAEIIPRQRPDEWNILGRLRKTKKPGALKGAMKKILAQDLDRPLRLTGQLFFDASHRVCANGKRIGGQPARVSNWEIHPVLAVDVCINKSLSGCAFDREDVWMSLDLWLAEGDDDQ